MIVDRVGEIDALHRIIDLLHHDLELPAVQITVHPDGSVRLDATARSHQGEQQVKQWASALGAPVDHSDTCCVAAGRLGAHLVTVWAAA